MQLSQAFRNHITSKAVDSKERRLLIVDDEKEITESLSELFRTSYTVNTAQSVDQALSLLNDYDFGVIIADQRMPEKTGTDLFSDNLVQNLDSVKILITGYTDLHAVVEAINIGRIFFYIKKPWSAEELKQIVENAFVHYELVQERQRLIRDLREMNKSLEEKVHERTAQLQRKAEELEKLNAYISSQAYIDPLTRVGNRRRIDETLIEEIKRSKKTGNPLSILLFDIDNFKQINDMYSHIVGDKVLQTITNQLDSDLRLNDLIGRFGGDEFIIIMPDTDLEEAVTRGNRMRERVGTITWDLGSGTNEDNLYVTISIGVSCLSVETGVEQFIQSADQALYRAKQGGKNQVMV